MDGGLFNLDDHSDLPGPSEPQNQPSFSLADESITRSGMESTGNATGNALAVSVKIDVITNFFRPQ